MIKLTRLTGEPFILNAELIEYVEAQAGYVCHACHRPAAGSGGIDG
jgi:hypothetical protein